MNTSKTWLWIIIAIGALALIVWAAGQYGFLASKTDQSLLDSDVIADISNDLNSVDIGTPSEDLKQMDADINSL
ncbi:MAG: hypothetical protein AAB456_01950 [Patescibacteria group bacterium]